MPRTFKGSLGGLLNIAIFSAITVGGLYFFVNSTFRQSADTDAKVIGKVITKSGLVQIRAKRFKSWAQAVPDAPLFDRTAVYTDADSRVELKVRAAKVQIEERTLVQIIDPERQTELAMDFGSLRLRSSQKANVILRVGGERMQIALNESAVKIVREKNSDSLKVESLEGDVSVTFEGKTPVNVAQGEEIKIATEPQPQSVIEDSPVAIAEPEPEPLRPDWKLKSTSDERFAKRPVWKWKLEAEKDASASVAIGGEDQWRDLPAETFKPEVAGTHRARVSIPAAQGLVRASAVETLNTDSKLFELRQPALQTDRAVVDPTLPAKLAPAIFAGSTADLETIAVKIPISGKTIELNAPAAFTYALLPPGRVDLRALRERNSGFAFEDEWERVKIVTPPPAPRLEGRQVQLPKIEIGHFYYETRQSPAQSCDAGCTVRIAYRSQLNPDWRSDESKIEVPALPPVRKLANVEKVTEEKLAAEKPGPLKSRKAFWILDAGAGGTYLDLKESSPSTNAKASGFNGTTFNLKAERRFETFGFALSYTDAQSKISTISDGVTASHSPHWRSAWAGVNMPSFSERLRFEAGFASQDLPLLYESSSGLVFEQGHSYSATLGINTNFPLSKNWQLLWDQRLLIPVSSSAGGSVTSYTAGMGVEGAIELTRCFDGGWGAGFTWFGQYSTAKYKMPASGTLLEDSPELKMLNSNLQFRVNYGRCPQDRR